MRGQVLVEITTITGTRACFRGDDEQMNRKNQDIERRSRQLTGGRRGNGPVVYWMSRDQRVKDNWALLRAQQEAIAGKRGLVVIFCRVPAYQGATADHYAFMLNGLAEVKKNLEEHNIRLVGLNGSPAEMLPSFLRKIDAALLVCDFDPLRIKRDWKKRILESVDIPMQEVDAHNVIPAWVVSDKKEYAAYTIRPKIRLLLDEYLTDIPRLVTHPFSWHEGQVSGELSPGLDLTASANRCRYDWLAPGEEQALAAARSFVGSRLADYPGNRNNPCVNGQSGLSPYLHFGHLSAQRLAVMVQRSNTAEDVRETFLEELIVRRELSDNFCLYEPSYDTFAGFPRWARLTLDEHRADPREYTYSLTEFEEGATHEKLWNACQTDLVRSGKLHGYLRMYWAKKILEWTPAPEAALEIAIYLNDRYSLDGRDPNGYTGICWSIGGVHDRAWKERPVFGKIRYMNEAGCRRKFDTAAYIEAVYRRRHGTGSA